MNVIYTGYAIDVIKDRKIKEGLIESALLNPDGLVEGKKGRKIAHKIIGDALLRVIYEIDNKTYIVITAYYAHSKRYKNESEL